jgi:hypothetical protein
MNLITFGLIILKIMLQSQSTKKPQLKSFFGEKAAAVKKIETKANITTNEVVKKRVAKNQMKTKKASIKVASTSASDQEVGECANLKKEVPQGEGKERGAKLEESLQTDGVNEENIQSKEEPVVTP